MDEYRMWLRYPLWYKLGYTILVRLPPLAHDRSSSD